MPFPGNGPAAVQATIAQRKIQEMFPDGRGEFRRSLYDLKTNTKVYERPATKIAIVFFTFVTVLLVGGFIFHKIEGVDLVKSIYYVANLSSTIGPGSYVAHTDGGLLFSMCYTTLSIPFFLSCSYQYSRSLVETFDRTLTSSLAYSDKPWGLKIKLLGIVWVVSSIFHITFGSLRFPENTFIQNVWSVYNIQTTIGLGWNFNKPYVWSWFDLIIALNAHLISVGNFVLLIDLIISKIEKKGRNFMKSLSTAQFSKNVTSKVRGFFQNKDMDLSSKMQVVDELKKTLDDISETISRNQSFRKSENGAPSLVLDIRHMSTEITVSDS